MHTKPNTAPDPPFRCVTQTDDYGHNIFETIKITLVRATHTHRHAPPTPTPPPLATQVCDDCLKTDHRAQLLNQAHARAC